MDENHYSYGHNVCWHEAGVADATNATWEGMGHSVFLNQTERIYWKATHRDLRIVRYHFAAIQQKRRILARSRDPVLRVQESVGALIDLCRTMG